MIQCTCKTSMKIQCQHVKRCLVQISLTVYRKLKKNDPLIQDDVNFKNKIKKWPSLNKKYTKGIDVALNGERVVKKEVDYWTIWLLLRRNVFFCQSDFSLSTS